MLICGQFIAKDVNLWSTLVYVCFEKLIFSDYWGPQNLLGLSKKTQLLDSWPLSMPLKSRPWGNRFKIFVLYLVYCSGAINRTTFPCGILLLLWPCKQNWKCWQNKNFPWINLELNKNHCVLILGLDNDTIDVKKCKIY